MAIRLTPLFSLSLLLAAIAGCTSTQLLTCSSNEHPVLLDSLYFGRATPGGIVTAEEWATFLADTVAPNFPEGLTSWVASGKWRTSAGLLEQETSYVLQLAHNENQEQDRAVHRIIQEYKNRFQQKAVMRIRSLACRSL